jgi:murein DD-endopeptidase MepM/ murein hydrolase activator NlpD
MPELACAHHRVLDLMSSQPACPAAFLGSGRLRRASEACSVEGVRWLAQLALLLALVGGATAHAQRGWYVVRPGDTLAEIARRHRVSVDALTRANRLREDAIRPGDRLHIPSSSADVPARRYRVRDGDTLARIARRNHVSIEELQRANGLRGETIRPGESLWIPRPGVSGAEVRAALREENPTTEQSAPTIAPERRAEAEERARSLGLGPVHVGQRLLRESGDARWIEAAGAFEDTQGTLLAPIDDGRYLRGWGSGVLGYHLAIDIGAAEGTPIRAAERGLVAYAGNGIRGYGNLVILVHANGWVTGYAHNVRNLVVAGQLVDRGEVVAHVGQTGYARGPHLHFMFVHQGRHCDPLPLFRPGLTRSDGTGLDVAELVWDAAMRPSGVQCLMRADRPHPYHEGRRERARRRAR